MNEGWIIVGLIIVGLALLCLVFWVGKFILLGAGRLFYWASEQEFLGIAAYCACWIFLFPFMLIACAIFGFVGWLSIREDERIATQSMQNLVPHQGHGLGREAIQEVGKLRYEVHVVPQREYIKFNIDDKFQGGRVINGFAGLENDSLIVTAHLDDGNHVTGMGPSEVQEVSKYSYLAHVVSAEEYARISLDDRYRGGTVINVFAGLGDDCLIITAHLDDGTMPRRST